MPLAEYSCREITWYSLYVLRIQNEESGEILRVAIIHSKLQAVNMLPMRNAIFKRTFPQTHLSSLSCLQGLFGSKAQPISSRSRIPAPATSKGVFLRHFAALNLRLVLLQRIDAHSDIVLEFVFGRCTNHRRGKGRDAIDR